MTEIKTNGVFPPGSLATTYLYYPGTTNGRQIREDIAPYAEAMATAFYLEFGKPLYATDGARDRATQEQLYREKPHLAAPPGTSNHGWARAFDLASGVATRGSREHKWILANEGRFGFEAPDWANNPRNRYYKDEPWHHEFVGGGSAAKRVRRPRKGEVGLGDSGPKVEEIQRLLNKALKPENRVVVDGKYGLGTAIAVYRYQTSRGLSGVGAVGPVTLRSLKGTSAPVKEPEGAVVYLKRGTSNEAGTRKLQAFLKRAFKVNANLVVDGDYGDATVAAVKHWQKKAGLAPTGEIGPKSRNRLVELGVFEPLEG